MPLVKISPRIHYLAPESATDRPTLGHVQGDRCALAIDAGNSAGHVAAFLAAVRACDLKDPAFIALTHWHWDHTFGMHAVSGVTIASQRTDARLRDVSRWGWSDAEMAARLAAGTDIEFCDRCIRLEYPDRSLIRVVPADLAFQGSLTIDLGSVHCVLMEVIAPHSDDNVIIHVPEERVLFLGDADGSDDYEGGGLQDRGRLLALKDLLKRLDFETCVPGHDEPVSKPQVLAYLDEMLAEAT